MRGGGCRLRGVEQGQRRWEEEGKAEGHKLEDGSRMEWRGDTR